MELFGTIWVFSILSSTFGHPLWNVVEQPYKLIFGLVSLISE